MNLREKFIHAVPMPNYSPMGQEVLHEPDVDPQCGFVTQQEALLLHSLAREHSGYWLEIGSHTGYSGAHIAKGLADWKLICVDPEYGLDSKRPEIRKRANENFRACGVKVAMYGGTSDKFFQNNSDFVFAGVLIDGNHDRPYPEQDAKNAYKCLRLGGVIVFHDGYSEPVLDGVRYLESVGMKIEKMDTAQGLVICRRGNI